MFEEAQYLAPVARGADGEVVVQLSRSHPGFADPAYRARRNAIAALADAYTPGDPIPVAEYTPAEHEVWRIVSAELDVRHRKYAARAYLDGKERLALPGDRVPLREFYGTLADSRFHSTQYIRHHTVPLYTPEPDVIHEVIGHANALANDRFAALYRLAGQAARRVETGEALEFVSKVFWFTMEFGVMAELGETKAYGAGILSSYGEIEEFGGMDIRPLDLAAMGTMTYDITRYQDVLFQAESMDHLEDVVGEFWATCDDDTVAALTALTA